VKTGEDLSEEPEEDSVKTWWRPSLHLRKTWWRLSEDLMKTQSSPKEDSVKTRMKT